MTPADIVKKDHLADAVCHEEQLVIWGAQIIDHLSDWIDPEDYDDCIRLAEAAQRAAREIVENAFSHPELLGLPTTSKEGQG